MAHRYCPQCFKGYESKAEFLSHMVEDWEHRYSKAAAMRAWKAADAKAKTEEQEAAVSALGLVACFGCKGAIDPKQAAAEFNPESEYSRHYYCGACYREVPGLGWTMRAYDSFGYGYDREREVNCSGYDSMEKAERHLRSHVAQMRSTPEDWTAGLPLIQNDEDKRDHLRLVAAWKTCHNQGYRSNGPGDPRWQAENERERAIYKQLTEQYL